MKVSLDQVADAYLELPPSGMDASAAEAWRQLGDFCHSFRRYVENGGLIIAETAQPEPYASAQDQADDIHRGRFIVSTAHSDHPLWDIPTNVAYRVWHDVAGHGSGRPAPAFNRYGELEAWRRQLSHPLSVSLRPMARSAAFTETVGQLAAAVRLGDFTDQRCGHLFATYDLPEVTV